MGRGGAPDVLDDAAVRSVDYRYVDGLQAVSGRGREGDDAAVERLRNGSRDHGKADPRRVADRGGADPVLSPVAGGREEDQASRRVYRGVDVVEVSVCAVGFGRRFQNNRPSSSIKSTKS